MTLANNLPPYISKQDIVTGNHAVAEAAALALFNVPSVVAAYPITPQTEVIEKLADFVGEGKLPRTEYIAVESEHSALAAVMGSSAGGVRSFTATSSHGLYYMYELVSWAGLGRFPIVMPLINRAPAPGWNIWVEHSDLYSIRDLAWISFVGKNNQEVHDMTIQAFRVSEDHDVMLPSVINMDAFILSHTSAPVDFLSQSFVDDFLPEFEPIWTLDPLDPVTYGPLWSPAGITEIREDINVGMANAKKLIAKITGEFTEITGRDTGVMVEVYGDDHADIGIISMGTWSEEAELAVDLLGEQGISAGATRIRTYRPFPAEEIVEAGKRYGRIIVLDRSSSWGFQGQLAGEVKASLYDGGINTPVKGIVTGLGGSDVTFAHIADMMTAYLKEDL
ncbi:MAG: transketolase C-terminal domain-containing protein [Candidatus Kariarchaeaceae archaeon]